jgi:hypothetical protein
MDFRRTAHNDAYGPISGETSIGRQIFGDAASVG